jgi:hypothetical protein
MMYQSSIHPLQRPLLFLKTARYRLQVTGRSIFWSTTHHRSMNTDKMSTASITPTTRVDFPKADTFR